MTGNEELDDMLPKKVLIFVNMTGDYVMISCKMSVGKNQHETFHHAVSSLKEQANELFSV